jgi:2-polyprenyl-6-methoxyphenol hydroxylase-like FAD-dependent oxidoreductase
MTNNKNVLISGASIAGPALAFWLRRFGFNPTVVERGTGLREGGSAVDFRGPVHLTVLRRMGILDEIRKHRTTPKKWVFVDDKGKQRASLPANFAGGDVEIRRGDLSHILYEATMHDTEYVFDDWITSVNETPHGVHVTFDKGAPRTFDLVVGADGMHSGVRALAFSAESEFSHFTGSYFASFSVPEHLERDRDLLIHNAPGLFACPGLLVFRAAEELSYDRRDIDAQKQLVASIYAGAGWRTPEYIQAMLDAQDFYLDSISHIKMEHLTRGRFALVGDAGYGATLGGMGTGMGIVGAYVLAGELAAADGDHRVAFPAFEQQMLPYARGAQGMGAGKFLAPATKAKIWQRNQLFKLFTFPPVMKLVGRFDMKVASNLALKDYQVP